MRLQETEQAQEAAVADGDARDAAPFEVPRPEGVFGGLLVFRRGVREDLLTEGAELGEQLLRISDARGFDDAWVLRRECGR